MKAYHGSSVLFDSFDLAAHALQGDGKCKFGFGVYVTDSYESAAHYAYNKKRPDNKDYYVYIVDIPDRTADNCLSLLKNVPVCDSIVQRTEQKLGIIVPEEAKVEGIPFRKYLANFLTGENKSVKQMTDKATIKGEEAASRFLLSIGVELIEWPHNWRKPDDIKNYAVLDDKKIRILNINKEQLDDKHHLIWNAGERIL